MENSQKRKNTIELSFYSKFFSVDKHHVDSRSRFMNERAPASKITLDIPDKLFVGFVLILSPAS
jgi:hypothetical protein